MILCFHCEQLYNPVCTVCFTVRLLRLFEAVHFVVIPIYCEVNAHTHIHSHILTNTLLIFFLLGFHCSEFTARLSFHHTQCLNVLPDVFALSYDVHVNINDLCIYSKQNIYSFTIARRIYIKKIAFCKHLTKLIVFFLHIKG